MRKLLYGILISMLAINALAQKEEIKKPRNAPDCDYRVISLKTIYREGQDSELSFLLVRWVTTTGEYKQTRLWAKAPGVFWTELPNMQLRPDYNGDMLWPVRTSESSYKSERALIANTRFVRRDVAFGYPAYVHRASARETTVRSPDGQTGIALSAAEIEVYYSPRFGTTVLKQVEKRPESTDITEIVDIKFHPDFDLRSIDITFLREIAKREEQAGHLSYAGQIRSMTNSWRDAVQRLQ